jgi:endonuclease IV
MNDRRFRDVPKVLETPKVGNMDHENLEKLRSLVK